MIKIVFFLLLVALTSCSVNQVVHEIQIRDNAEPNFPSIIYYSFGEVLLLEGEIYKSLMHFREAEKHDPKSLYIRERIIFCLSALSTHSPNFLDELIIAAENYLKDDVYNNNIVINLANAYLQREEVDKAISMYKLSVDLDKTPLNYLRLFVMQSRYLDFNDFSLLSEALKLPGMTEQIYLSIAEIYSYYDDKKAEEIYLGVLDKYKSTTALKEAANYYLRKNLNNEALDLIFNHKSEGINLDSELVNIFLRLLFLEEIFEYIEENFHTFLYNADDNGLKILYHISRKFENYNHAINAGKLLIQRDDAALVSEDAKKAAFADLYFKNMEIRLSAETYLAIDDLYFKIFYIDELLFKSDSKPEHISIFFNELEGLVEEKYLVNLLKARKYLLDNDKVRAKEALNKIQLEKELPDEVIEVIIELYLETQLYELDTIKKLRNMLIEKTVSDNLFFAIYFYQNNNYEKAQKCLIDEINKEDYLPDEDVFLFLAQIYNHQGKLTEQIEIMEIALNYYPENAEILNWLGYSLVEAEKDLDRAEVLLNKAIQIKPDSVHIWDSVAWLHYKKGDYEKAINSMNFPKKMGIDNSVIAYHIARIYYKLNKKDKVLKYLKLAVEINSDSEYVQKSKDFMDKIGEDKQ